MNHKNLTYGRLKMVTEKYSIEFCSDPCHV